MFFQSLYWSPFFACSPKWRSGFPVYAYTASVSVRNSNKPPYLYVLSMGQFLEITCRPEWRSGFSRIRLHSLCGRGKLKLITIFVRTFYGAVSRNRLQAKMAVGFFPYTSTQLMWAWETKKPHLCMYLNFQFFFFEFGSTICGEHYLSSLQKHIFVFMRVSSRQFLVADSKSVFQRLANVAPEIHLCSNSCHFRGHPNLEKEIGYRCVFLPVEMYQ